MKKNPNIKFAASALSILCCTVIPNAYATLASNAILNFSDGVTSCVLGADPSTATGCTYDVTTTSGSYFGVDFSGNEVIEQGERFAMTSAGVGLTLGAPQAVGEIDQGADVAANLWRHFTTQGLTVNSTLGNTASLDMTGWTVDWNGGNIPWGTGSYATVTCGIDCSIGDSFVLHYAAPNPNSGAIYGLYYELHLEGTIASAVPVPAAVWLFGSGLIGLFGFSKKRNR